VGEQTAEAYAWVNFTPSLANRSMFGVLYRLFSSVSSVWNGTEVSCQPMSSTRKTTTFGLPFNGSAAGRVPAVTSSARRVTIRWPISAPCGGAFPVVRSVEVVVRGHRDRGQRVKCWTMRAVGTQPEQHRPLPHELARVRGGGQAVQQPLDGVPGEDELELLALTAAQVSQPGLHRRGHVLRVVRAHARASRYGRMTLAIRRAWAARYRSSTVARRSRRQSRRASRATSSPTVVR